MNYFTTSMDSFAAIAVISKIDRGTTLLQQKYKSYIVPNILQAHVQKY